MVEKRKRLAADGALDGLGARLRVAKHFADLVADVGDVVADAVERITWERQQADLRLGILIAPHRARAFFARWPSTRGRAEHVAATILCGDDRSAAHATSRWRLRVYARLVCLRVAAVDGRSPTLRKRVVQRVELVELRAVNRIAVEVARVLVARAQPVPNHGAEPEVVRHALGRVLLPVNLAEAHLHHVDGLVDHVARLIDATPIELRIDHPLALVALLIREERVLHLERLDGRSAVVKLGLTPLGSQGVNGRAAVDERDHGNRRAARLSVG